VAESAAEQGRAADLRPLPAGPAGSSTGVEVRPAGVADAAGIAAVYAPYVHSGVATFEGEPPPPAVLATRMTTGLPWFVACAGPEVVGYAYASPHHERAAYRWTVECTVYLAPAACGQGVGSALYGRLLPVLSERGLVTALAKITLPNAASIALHERAGFHQVGVLPQVGFKLGAWHDVGLWARSLVRDLPVPPAGGD